MKEMKKNEINEKEWKQGAEYFIQMRNIFTRASRTNNNDTNKNKNIHNKRVDVIGLKIWPTMNCTRD